MVKMDTCSKCGRLVLPARMADHWIIEKHYSPNLPAVLGPASRSKVMRDDPYGWDV